MIKVNNISKSFGQEYIFKDVTFNIKSNDKIAIVGKNGAGKTTLLKSIVQDDYLNSGEIENKGSIGYIKQSLLEDENNTVYEEYMNVFPKLKKLNKYLSLAKEDEKYTKQYIKYEEEFSASGGYEINTKINKLLTGFGFEKEDINRKIKTFSGGQKTKLSLIKLLVIEPDFLFLDEPTNHLDINTIWWLEKYLKSLKKAVIIVSHDQMFIDSICNKIIEVKQQNIEIYNTNFSNYIKQRELNYQYKLNEYEKQQKMIKKYEEFIIKNNGTSSKIGQVNDRKNKLKQLKEVQKPVNDNKKLNFEFKNYHLKKSTYIDFFNVYVGYDNKELIKDFNFKLYGGEKIAIIGENGAGKTTLFKAILEGKLISGKIKIPSNIKIGYFDQEQKQLNEEDTLYDVIDKTKQFESTTAIRKYLGQFLFVKDDVFKKVRNLSGGEKIRIILATMALEKYDILLLDEPTNHLDYDTKNILQQALKNFPGSIMFITHDRTLINEVASKILEVKDQKIQVYNGNWEYYKSIQQQIKKENLENKKQQQIIHKDDSTKLETKKSSNIKKKKNINVQKVKILEEDIYKYEEQLEKLNEKIIQKDNLKNYEKQKELLLQIQEINNKLNALYTKYDECFK